MIIFFSLSIIFVVDAFSLRYYSSFVSLFLSASDFSFFNLTIYLSFVWTSSRVFSYLVEMSLKSAAKSISDVWQSSPGLFLRIVANLNVSYYKLFFRVMFSASIAWISEKSIDTSFSDFTVSISIFNHYASLLKWWSSCLQFWSYLDILLFSFSRISIYSLRQSTRALIIRSSWLSSGFCSLLTGTCWFWTRNLTTSSLSSVIFSWYWYEICKICSLS